MSGKSKSVQGVAGSSEGNLRKAIEIRCLVRDTPLRFARHGNCCLKQQNGHDETRRYIRWRAQRVVTAIGLRWTRACVGTRSLQVPASCIVAPQPTTRTISKITGDSRNYPALSRYAFLRAVCRRDIYTNGVTPTSFRLFLVPVAAELL